MNVRLASISALLLSVTAMSARQLMPITFEQNQGQAAADVKFISRGASGVLLLSPKEIDLRAPGQDAQFRLNLLGASTTSVIGSGESSGTVNYFRGAQASAWLTGIPSFTKVTYKSVYPNIDLVVYGNNRQFESDFVVAQGADPAAIALRIDGKLEIRQDGSLAVESQDGAFQLHRPFVYQLASNGDRLPIDSHYTISEGNQIGFALGSYDHAKSLVIDPILSYATYLGGSKDDKILGISGDMLGNVYVVGQTTSIDFPTSHPIKPKEAGDADCFVSKFDSTGQHLIYSTYLGGSNTDGCSTVAVNFMGEAFVGGSTYSTDFPTNSALQGTFKGVGPNAVDGFVAHLDSTGSRLIFSTYLGGGGEFLTGLALDPLSNVYVVGVTNSPNYPVTKGAYQNTCKGPCYDNAFLSKISAAGSQLVYSTFLGGSTNYDSANGVAVDFTGSAYVTGEAHSTDFPTTKGAYQPKIAGFSNAFVTKFSPDGSSLEYSTFIGGSNFDSARSIAIDLFGNAYIAGATNSTNFPTVNAFQAAYKGTGYPNIFVLKLNSKASALTYSTYLGGSQYNYPFGISVDLSGNASVAGETTSTDFPTKAPLQSAFGGGNLDAVVASFNTSGTLEYSTYLGGSGDDYGFAIYSDPCGAVWVGGTTTSSNFPTAKAYQGKFAGSSDAFLAHLTH